MNDSRIDRESNHSVVSQIFLNSISKIKVLRFPIVILWIVINVFGLLYGLKFFDETTTEFVAPNDSDAAKATDAINEYFPSQSGVHWAIIYIKVCNY
jgi:hypothetical protein